jgi:hypothetical protein
MEKNPQEFSLFFKSIIMTKIIGLTGGIGSGKLRCKSFQSLESRLYSGRRQQ